jgi:hypothetical protein
MWVPAEDLELAVFVDLFKCFGNADAVRRAVEAAMPDQTEVSDLHGRKERLDADLRKVKEAKKRIIDSIAAGVISNEDAKAKNTELKEREDYLIEQADALSKQLESMPTAEQIQATGERLASKFHTLDWFTTSTLNSDFAGMTYEDKRALVEMVFGGRTADGTKMGVWVSWVDGERDRKRGKRWRYRIVGHLAFDREGLTPVEYPVPDEDGQPLTGGSRQRKLLQFNESRKRGVRGSSF